MPLERTQEPGAMLPRPSSRTPHLEPTEPHTMPEPQQAVATAADLLKVKASPVLVSRVKLVLGLLAVWVAFLSYQTWKEYVRISWWEYRLEEGQVCELKDGGSAQRTPLPLVTWSTESRMARLLM